MNSLGWSRRDADIPVSTSQQSGLLSSIKSLNPFGDRGYVRLPTTESAGAPLPAPSRREEEEGWFVCESIRVLGLSPNMHALEPPSRFCPGSFFPCVTASAPNFSLPCVEAPMQDMCRSYRCLSPVHMNVHLWRLSYLRPSHPDFAAPLFSLSILLRDAD